MVWLVVTTKNAEYAKGVLRMTRHGDKQVIGA